MCYSFTSCETAGEEAHVSLNKGNTIQLYNLLSESFKIHYVAMETKETKRER